MYGVLVCGDQQQTASARSDGQIERGDGDVRVPLVLVQSLPLLRSLIHSSVYIQINVDTVHIYSIHTYIHLKAAYIHAQFIPHNLII